MAGFGRIVDLKPEQFLTDMTDAAALLEAEQGAVEHMNADHREAMNLYATRLLGAEPADWRCTGCDPDGIDMQAGSATLRLDFPRADCHPCRAAADAEAACRSGPRCSKCLSQSNRNAFGINQKPTDRLGKPGVHQY